LGIAVEGTELLLNTDFLAPIPKEPCGSYIYYNHIMTRHLLLIPTTACQAGCAYCFGPRYVQPPMSQRVLEGVVAWLGALEQEERLQVTFHGGEPLLTGVDFFREAMPRIRHAWTQPVGFAVQSNLWRLDDAYGELFAEYHVGLGTSLDGPEEINDAQRGEGYFRRTMTGIEMARKHGLEVGCIVTFTAQSLPHWREVAAFFQREGLNFAIHAASPGLSGSSMAGEKAEWAVPAEAYGVLLVELLAFYLENLATMRIPTLDAICRSVSAGKGGICTFGDCLGKYLAIAPDGSIYPCQRFVGQEAFRLGSVFDQGRLADSPAWRVLAQRQERVRGECGACAFLDICLGGCPYDALAAGQARDPYCASYQRIFEEVVNRGVEEALSEENLALALEEPDAEGGLLRKGKVVSLLRGSGR